MYYFEVISFTFWDRTCSISSDKLCTTFSHRLVVLSSILKDTDFQHNFRWKNYTLHSRMRLETYYFKDHVYGQEIYYKSCIPSLERYFCYRFFSFNFKGMISYLVYGFGIVTCTVSCLFRFILHLLPVYCMT